MFLMYLCWGCGALGVCVCAVTVVGAVLSCARFGACWDVETRGSVKEVLRVCFYAVENAGFEHAMERKPL
jgi:hypothetical protein